MKILNGKIISKQNLLLLGIMISAVLIDQLSKIWLTSTLQIGESIELILKRQHFSVQFL